MKIRVPPLAPPPAAPVPDLPSPPPPPTPAIPLSLLDLATIRPHQSARESLDTVVAVARRAEDLNYRRIWYAEHHNFAGLASATPSVLIAHVAAHTDRIRLGSGGVMLPNHSPLSVAEQFGLLETLHPGRID